MQTEIFSYSLDDGWSRGFPNLDGESTQVVVFGGSNYLDEQGPIDELRKAFPNSKLIGCSTAGEILGDTIIDDSLVVAVTRFDRTRLKSCCVPVGDATESLRVGGEIAERLAAPDLRAVFVLSDGLNVNGTTLARGLTQALDERVVITGGLAGDGSRFERTWVTCAEDIRSGAVVAIGYYGDHVRVSHACKGGWDPFGPERIVTESDGNKLFQLDGKPALSLYKEYLGDLAKGLPATALLFPLAVKREGEARTLVRTVLAVDEHENSMTFAGDIPKNAVAQLMRGNFDRIVHGAAEAGDLLQHDGAPAPGSICFAISCVGRRLVLKHRVEEELEEVVRRLPPGTVQTGFYSYGELSPIDGSACELHNQTMTLTLISEV